MRAYVVAAVAAAILAAPQVQAGVPATAAQAASEIETRGAAAFLAGLTPDQIDQLYEHFVGGDPKWLALVPMLAPAADAGSAEGLTISLAFALPKNAKGVLALTTIPDGILSVQRVCSIPFIEDTVRDLAGYRRKAMAAVAKVKDPSLAAVRDVCLTTLKRSK